MEERSDKGTVRELTEIADMILKESRIIMKELSITRRDIEDGRNVRVAFDKLEEAIDDRFGILEKEVRSYDQRDRLKHDPSILD